MITWLISSFGGIFRTQRQSSFILLIFSVILLFISSYIVLNSYHFFSRFNSVSLISNISSQNKIRHSHPHTTIVPATTVITITADGFAPKEVSIIRGQSLTWINEDSLDHWPASDDHPSHTNYPAQYSETGTYFQSVACQGPLQPKTNAFDPCGPLESGAQWTFIFDTVGVWHYHDHIYPELKGTVTVREK